MVWAAQLGVGGLHEKVYRSCTQERYTFSKRGPRSACVALSGVKGLAATHKDIWACETWCDSLLEPGPGEAHNHKSLSPSKGLCSGVWTGAFTSTTLLVLAASVTLMRCRVTGSRLFSLLQARVLCGALRMLCARCFICRHCEEQLCKAVALSLFLFFLLELIVWCCLQ